MSLRLHILANLGQDIVTRSTERPSILRSTALWFGGALLGSVVLFLLGLGGNPAGLVMITLLPWLFWLGPAIGAWRSCRLLDRFAAAVPGKAEASSPILGYPTLRWPQHGFEVEIRYHGISVMGLFIHVDGAGTAKATTDRVEQAARAAVEGRIEAAKQDGR